MQMALCRWLDAVIPHFFPNFRVLCHDVSEEALQRVRPLAVTMFLLRYFLILLLRRVHHVLVDGRQIVYRERAGQFLVELWNLVGQILK